MMSDTHLSSTISDDELAQLIQNIYQKYGYDFSSYHAQNLKQSIGRYLKKHGESSINLEKPDISIVEALWNNTSFFYRNEDVFLTLKEKVFPELKQLDTVKIWHAACAKGEEVYSLAILLKEQGLLEKTEIFASDISQENLNMAQKATYLNTTTINSVQKAYQKAGGTKNIQDYFYPENNFIKILHPQSYPIHFFQHDLLKGEPLQNIDLILCRNMLIYIGAKAYKKILQLLSNSLAKEGFLCLGAIETALPLIGNQLNFFDRKANIYQKNEDNLAFQGDF